VSPLALGRSEQTEGGFPAPIGDAADVGDRLEYAAYITGEVGRLLQEQVVGLAAVHARMVPEAPVNGILDDAGEKGRGLHSIPAGEANRRLGGADSGVRDAEPAGDGEQLVSSEPMRMVTTRPASSSRISETRSWRPMPGGRWKLHRSAVSIPAVANGQDQEEFRVVLIGLHQHSPIAYAQPKELAPLETNKVTVPGLNQAGNGFADPILLQPGNTTAQILFSVVGDSDPHPFQGMP
jgi:hypothetical protein